MTRQRLCLRPNKRHKTKIIVCLLLAVIALSLPSIVVIGRDLYVLVLSVGILCAMYTQERYETEVLVVITEHLIG